MDNKDVNEITREVEVINGTYILIKFKNIITITFINRLEEVKDVCKITSFMDVEKASIPRRLKIVCKDMYGWSLYDVYKESV